MTNHLTRFLVEIYQGMGLLTTEEEKRFPRERESFTMESSEKIEDENRSPAVPTHTTARGPVQVDVVQRQKQPERRVTKRRKVVSDDEEELAHVVRRMDMDESGARRTELAQDQRRGQNGGWGTFGGVNQSFGSYTGRTFEGGNGIEDGDGTALILEEGKSSLYREGQAFVNKLGWHATMECEM
ncbi:hypothetical protein AXG93_297s1010 [Marchantia polymorpha subsp. ruderalis]|uniref:Uncharacterized protein n=1 Tax=Marchantia polymorpha subsp. ruderalis TaxID=1480154 RepID=A0A176VL16_MARPO|nr:hypothetical protein AXG93_297s1010 [Marchantia polymorpha subsp. ruderalis]